MFYVLYMDNDDADETSFGGGIAYESEDEQDAIDEAISNTDAGIPCYIEDEYGDEIWNPEYCENCREVIG